MVIAEAQRTLVKSPPELWSELSDPAALARHLGELGEIRIVRTKPEETVEWEAADSRGKVEITPSGWGTKVTLSVTIDNQRPEPAPEPAPQESIDAAQPARNPTEAPQPAREVSQAVAPTRAPSSAPCTLAATAAGRSSRPPAALASPAVVAASEPTPGQSREPEREGDTRARRPLVGLLARLRMVRWAISSRRRGAPDSQGDTPSHAVGVAGLAAMRATATDSSAPSGERTPDAQHERPTAAARAAEAQHERAAEPDRQPVPAPEPSLPEPSLPEPLAATAQPRGPAGMERACVGDHGTTISAGQPGEQAAETTALLTAVLDRLGEAHHRPFSRA